MTQKSSVFVNAHIPCNTVCLQTYSFLFNTEGDTNHPPMCLTPTCGVSEIDRFAFERKDATGKSENCRAVGAAVSTWLGVVVHAGLAPHLVWASSSQAHISSLIFVGTKSSFKNSSFAAWAKIVWLAKTLRSNLSQAQFCWTKVFIQLSNTFCRGFIFIRLRIFTLSFALQSSETWDLIRFRIS